MRSTHGVGLLLLLGSSIPTSACSGPVDPSRDGSSDAARDGVAAETGRDAPMSDATHDDVFPDTVTVETGADVELDTGFDAAGDATDGGSDAGAADAGPVTYGTTYYVRTDGGSATQCTGLVDAPYPGSGTARACAWSSPEIALPASGSARIRGSDTLLIGPGTYEVGASGYLQPVPSGATAATPTRILGQSCLSPPILAGINGIHRVVNLDGTSNVEVGCLEITDRSDCVFNHMQPVASCDGDTRWARTGIYARGSTSAWLHDLDIHGLGARGIQAGALREWTVERVRLRRNGSAGWDGNVGIGASSNEGNMIFRDIEISWNGCGERWMTGDPWACWAQTMGGYGDGFGTTDTGGVWLIEDAYIHHNTSDGLDLRYMDGADSTRVTLRRIRSVANAGNQIKVRGNALVENSVMVGHCTYFRGQYYMAAGDLCRASGSSLLLVLTGNDNVIVRHNTIAGEGDALIGYTEGTSSDRIAIQNNAMVGFPYFVDATDTLFAGGDAPGPRTFSGNLGYHTRNCPSTGAICGTDPVLANMALASFDAVPLATSPLIDAAPPIAEVVDDFLRNPRPAGAGPDIGAYEVR